MSTCATHRAAGLLLALALLAASSAPVAASRIEFVLEAPSNGAQTLSDGDVVTIPLHALYTLTFTIVITDCFRLTVDIAIGGQQWDNDIFPLPLQPMNKIIWREEEYNLAAQGIFRAVEKGTYRILVRYSDEKKSLSYTFTIKAE